MDKHRLTCKVCPVGCKLIISKDSNEPYGYKIEGNNCNRGVEFGIKEIIEPSRILTGRVILNNGPMSRLPVKTSDVIPENLVDKCMEIIRETEVTAPINKGDIIIKNILNTGVDVIAARKINSLK
ncbi:DUF1667 domain-containing protein [Tissierella sp. MSJ-40]|uniref:DUF1667 domain-containing protein n=1 Tax=Tissierella simiarum TaxID=2841534 RepID=A0ABS6E4W2_9FIRM|nr:DUF1667 domain-containing protein [Tissierella simiarum]MBU5437817.1 DUF1667 domain-containing protein [Tissierella simiarum]